VVVAVAAAPELMALLRIRAGLAAAKWDAFCRYWGTDDDAERAAAEADWHAAATRLAALPSPLPAHARNPANWPS
jgi:hypothetical protein